MELYIPEENAGMIQWAEKFKINFPVVGRSKGIPEEKIEIVLKACDRLIAMCKKSEQDKLEGKTDAAFEEEKVMFAKALASL